MENPGKMKPHPCKFHKIVLHLLEFPRPNIKTSWKFHMIFFITPENFASFFIDFFNFHILFFQYLWKSHVLSLPCFNFSGTAHSCSHRYITETKIFALVAAATWLYLVTGRYFARKVRKNVMKNKTLVDNGRDKNNRVIMR